MMSSLRTFDSAEISHFEFKGLRLAQSERLMKVSTDSRLLTAFASRNLFTEVLDAGCGIGVIGLLLAVHDRNLNVTLIDSDPFAVELTGFNIASNGIENAEALHADIRLFQSEKRFDLIVGNPPYFTVQMTSQNRQRMGFRHASNRFPFHFSLMCKRNLSHEGQVCLVLPCHLEQHWTFQMALQGLVLNRYVEVRYDPLTPPSFILLSYSFVRTALSRSVLHMKEENGREDEALSQFIEGF